MLAVCQDCDTKLLAAAFMELFKDMSSKEICDMLNPMSYKAFCRDSLVIIAAKSVVLKAIAKVTQGHNIKMSDIKAALELCMAKMPGAFKIKDHGNALDLSTGPVNSLAAVFIVCVVIDLESQCVCVCACVCVCVHLAN